MSKTPTIRATIVPVTQFQQNCSIIWCEKTKNAAVIDPGGDLDHVLSALKQNDLTLEKILLTHAHIDHAGATSELASKFEVPIEGPHTDDQFLIDDLPAQSKLFGFPPAKTFTPSRWLNDNDTVTVGESTWLVKHCPGHTPGHVIFFNQEAQLAIVGDVLFQGSIGRTDFPRGDHQTLINSIRQNLWPLGDEVSFIPGHGPMSTFGQERRTNPFVGDGVA